MRSLLLAASLVALAPAAMAQGLPPGMPSGMPQGIPLTPPAERQAPRPLPPLPTANPDRQAEVGTPAPMPVQPEGGFRLPTGGAVPVAQNLSGAPGYARTLQDDGSRRLSEMTGKAPGSAGKLDSAPIANQGDLEAITNGQRNIVTLKQQVEEAKLAVELWHVLYNNDDAKTLREKQEKAAEVKVKEDKDREEKAQAQAATISAGAAMASALRTPPEAIPPKVVEVNGGKALLLVPGSGEVWVRPGDSVAGGWRITAVMPKSVRVTGPKGKLTLGYGDSVGSSAPAMPPQMPQQPRPMGMAPRI